MGRRRRWVGWGMDTSFKLYATDLTDAEWGHLRALLAPEAHAGRPRLHSLRTILNAIFHQLRTGGAWRFLPQEWPPWQTVTTICAPDGWMAPGSGCTPCCASGCAFGWDAMLNPVRAALTASRSRPAAWLGCAATMPASR